MKFRIVVLLLSIIALGSCEKDPAMDDGTPVNTYVPTPYQLIIPTGFPTMDIPQDNPMTVEGVALGRKLFYDPILSADSTQSCASCHNQAFAFTDNGKQFSTGIDGIDGDRNAPAIINVGWLPSFVLGWKCRYR